MIFNSDSYDALMAMEEARTGHYGEDYFDNGSADLQEIEHFGV